MISPKWRSCWKLNSSKSAVVLSGCVVASLVFLILANRNSSIDQYEKWNPSETERIDFDATKSRYIEMLRDGAYHALELELGEKEAEWGNDPDFWNLLGSAAMGARDFPRANEYFEKAAAIDGSVQSRFNVAEALFCLRKHDEAVVIFDEIASSRNYDESIRKLSEFKAFVCRLLSDNANHEESIKEERADVRRWFLLAVRLNNLKAIKDRKIVLDIDKNKMDTWEAPYEDTLRTAFLVDAEKRSVPE